MANSDNLKVVQEMYAAMGRNEPQEVMKCLSSKVDWAAVCPDDMPIGGTYSGREGVAKYLEKLQEAVDVASINLYEFIPSGDYVVVLGHEKGTSRGTGKNYEFNFSHVFTVSDGAIVKGRLFFDTAALQNALQ
eukprot:gb/GECH01012727.1/.p1 GENE.gb/GECH01012727.1/~~gb/GECH01012727.1/.p1  ORF type:complete len:133 (+),score=28.20 gb/GECH01012727.1/:1-399(+)